MPADSEPDVCPVDYVEDSEDDVHAPVHLVVDHIGRRRAAANCGAMPGDHGWVIWQGEVPAARWC